MYLGIRGRVELIVIHPFIQELFPESSSTQLDNIKLLTASVEPPQRQRNDHEEEEYRLASEHAFDSKPIVLGIPGSGFVPSHVGSLNLDMDLGL